MFCPKCGTENADQSLFCKSCGYRIEKRKQLDSDSADTGNEEASGDSASDDSSVALAFEEKTEEAEETKNEDGNAPSSSGAKPEASTVTPVLSDSTPSGTSSSVTAAPAAASAGTAVAVANVTKAGSKTKLIVVSAIAAVVLIVAIFGIYKAFLAPYPIDDSHFPDGTFRAYVSANFDTDKDGKLSRDEAKKVEYLGSWDDEAQDYKGSLTKKGISTLKGIEYFVNLKSIVASDNPITSVDLSKNTSLELVVLKCDSLATLNVSGCGKITNLWAGGTTNVSGVSGSLKQSCLVDTMESSSSSSTRTEQCNYSPDGLLLSRDSKSQSTSSSSSSSSSTSTRKFKYDENKRCICDTSITSGGKVSYTKTFEYDSKGKLKEQQYLDSSDDLKATKTFEYDDSGNLSSTVLVNEGKYGNTATTNYTYENGYLTSGSYETAGSSYSTTTTIACEYDGKQRLTDFAIDSWKYETELVYDDAGRVIQQTASYDDKTYEVNFDVADEGRSITSSAVSMPVQSQAYKDGTMQWTYEYNGDGLLVRAKTYANGELSYDNEYSYNEYGILTQSTSTSYSSNKKYTYTNEFKYNKYYGATDYQARYKDLEVKYPFENFTLESGNYFIASYPETQNQFVNRYADALASIIAPHEASIYCLGSNNGYL